MSHENSNLSRKFFMFDIYLTDVQQRVQFNDYPGEHPVKFILNFKKIFPSVIELLLPVLPENENLEEMTWESTQKDLALFKLLLSGWGVIELRLNAIAQFKDKKFADDLAKKAQQKRKAFAKEQVRLSQMELDYLFMHEIHGLIDAELVEIGEKFYVPTLRALWKDKIPASVLEAKF